MFATLFFFTIMDPVALQLGPLEIRWYGICVALGFLGGYGILNWRCRKLGLPEEAPGDVVFAAMLGGIGGARLLYVLQNWNAEFASHPLEALMIWRGGLVFYGGFIGATLAVTFWSRRKKWALGKIADAVSPALPLGHACGRIGCLLNGCCYGHPWAGGITYHQHTAGGVVDITVFPIQLVASFANLGLCGLFLYLSRFQKLRNRLFPLYLTIYPIVRFLIEFGRGDYPQRHFGLTPAQIVCFLIFPIGLGLWFHSRPTPSPQKTQ